MEIAATIFGILAAATISFVVYIYKNRITYELISMTHAFTIEDGAVKKSNSWDAIGVTFERIKIRNRGMKNINSIQMFLEHTPELFDFVVSDVNSIAKDTIRHEKHGDSLKISIDFFPRNEEISIDIAYDGRRYSPHRDLRGVGSDFRTQKLSHFLANRRFLLLALVGLVITIASNIVGVIVK